MTVRTYKAEHWIYSYVPRAWDDIDAWWKYITWALLSKDDGFFGENSANWPDWNAALIGGKPQFVPSLWIALKWRLRNPSCNLINYGLAWRGLPFSDGVYSYLLAQWSETDGWRLLYRKHLNTWSQSGRQFSLALLPPNVQYRGASIEGYFGWAMSETYKFGIALRKANSTGA